VGVGDQVFDRVHGGTVITLGKDRVPVASFIEKACYRPWEVEEMQNPKGRTLQTMRYFGAVALLAVGAVHLQQYLGDDYDSIPTIGPLFLLNAIGSGVIAIGLLLPIERVLARRADAVVGLLALGAVIIAVTSLIMLFVSESISLFGFTESGYRAAVVIAILAEAATTLLLAPVAAIRTTRALSRPPQPSEPAFSR
jgi:hypothetical protein